ncbi:MAG: hypothetical protein WBH44_01725 [Proteocatella sp.]
MQLEAPIAIYELRDGEIDGIWSKNLQFKEATIGKYENLKAGCT